MKARPFLIAALVSGAALIAMAGSVQAQTCEGAADGGTRLNVIVNGEYQRSDLWPSCNWLYNVAVGGRRETRGSMAFLLPIGALVVLFVLDVRFSLLFWNLRHGLEVYGGEPTDWYYAMQRGSRIASIIGVFVLAAMSFAVH